MITVNVVTCQDGAVQFSDKIEDFPTDLKLTQSSGNHSLNGQQFQTHWTDTITSPPNLTPWPKTAFDIAKYCLPLFISFFEDRNFGVNSNKTPVDLLAFKYKE
jgi:hypothetical protein